MRCLPFIFLGFVLLNPAVIRARETFDSPSPDGHFALHQQFDDEADRLQQADLVRLPSHEVVLSLSDEVTFSVALVWSADGRFLAAQIDEHRGSIVRVFRRAQDTFTELTVPEVTLPVAQYSQVRRGSRWVFDYLKPVRWLRDGTLISNAIGKIQLYHAPKLPAWLVYDYEVKLKVGKDAQVHLGSIRKHSVEYATDDT